MKLGIVGLPNVGKSTLFNAITQAGAESANYPFCTIEPNVGVVSVPDERLDRDVALALRKYLRSEIAVWRVVYHDGIALELVEIPARRLLCIRVGIH